MVFLLKSSGLASCKAAFDSGSCAWASARRCRPTAVVIAFEQAVEARLGALYAAGHACRKRASWCSARIRPCISIHHLLRVGVGAAGGPSRSACCDAAPQRVLPGLHHAHQLVADRAGPVVVLDRAADVDAAGVDFDRDALDPARQTCARSRGRPRGVAHAGIEHLLLEMMVVELAATSRSARSSREPKCAKTPDLLMCILSASRPMVRPSRPSRLGQPKRHIEDRSAGKFAFAHEFRCRVGHDGAQSKPVRDMEKNQRGT